MSTLDHPFAKLVFGSIMQEQEPPAYCCGIQEDTPDSGEWSVCMTIDRGGETVEVSVPIHDPDDTYRLRHADRKAWVVGTDFWLVLTGDERADALSTWGDGMDSDEPREGR
jgi:hypothetical protein